MIQHPLHKELFQITFAASVAGPMTWPLAAKLIAQQQGLFKYAFFDVLKKNGARVAFSGCLPYSAYKLFGIGAQRGVQAPVLTYMEANNRNTPAFIRYAIAGTLSGIIGGFIVTPIEQMKISLANRHFPNLPAASKYYSNNIKQLLSGARITIYRNIVYDAINCILYNYSLNNSFYKIDKQSFVHMSVINSIAGVLTAIIDYPLDVLKTRIQSVDHSRVVSSVSIASGTVVPHTPWRLAMYMIKHEGFPSLYYGLKEKLGLYFYVWFVFGIGYSTAGKMLNLINV